MQSLPLTWGGFFIYGLAMLSRKKTKKAAVSRRKSKKKISEKNFNIQHYNAVLIEDLKSEFKFVIEHVSGVEERLNRKMDEKFEEIDQNFEDVRRILSHHSKMLDQNEERWKQNEERWKQNDVRLDRIETKLDVVADKVAEHDQILKKLTA